jgi:hypothetical protein
LASVDVSELEAAVDNGENDPSGLLDELGALRRRTRTARHGYWFPLVLFGVLGCAAAPFYVQDDASTGSDALPVLGGTAEQNGLGYYWLVALLGGLLLTLLWYRWNARRVGLLTPARGYIAVTVTLVAVASGIPQLTRMDLPSWLGWLRYLNLLWVGDMTIRGTFPFLIIAVGLWILAWAERSWALTGIAALYTGAALLSDLYDTENVLFRLGWTPTGREWDYTTLPNVLLPALVLLIAGAAAFAVQRRPRAAQSVPATA